ncbi:DMT family transporter [Paraliobacillus sediminis]|uniref:DMT family transporter n=1 Tax=Paraliobacillus sediminis TaxID=1885916 RepID=UPI001F07F839|nr:DMT family transporter [Paraliobacillus sediminis]
MQMNHYFAYGLVILGASFWGLTGLFVENLYAFNFTPWQVVTVRLSVSSFILFIILASIARSYLKIRIKDLPYFMALGVVSMALFNWCYFEVMERSTLSVAVIFIYTSPAFTAIIARFLFKEKLPLQKIIAVFLTIIGCGFVIQFLPIGSFSLTSTTIILGLLSGLFCSSYSIIGKFASRIYHPLTITVYSMICGSIFMIPTSSIWTQKEAFMIKEVWLNILGISIISTIFAYILFTIGLSYVESSKASILSSFELVIAVLIGLLLLNEMLSSWQVFGFILVFLSLFLTVFSFRINRTRPIQN